MTVPGARPSFFASTSSRTHLPVGGRSPILSRSGVPSLPQAITFWPQYARWLQAPDVPLEHDLLGRIERIEIDLGEEGVSLADLELPPGVLEEPLLEPLGRDPQARPGR